jgi:prepilin-type N-terminal cleavage/methylation domain-containing protein
VKPLSRTGFTLIEMMIVIAVLGIMTELLLMPMSRLLEDVKAFQREIPRQDRILHAFAFLRSTLVKHESVQVVAADHVRLSGDHPMDLRREADGKRIVFIRDGRTLIVELGDTMIWGHFTLVSARSFSCPVTVASATFPLVWRVGRP